MHSSLVIPIQYLYKMQLNLTQHDLSKPWKSMNAKFSMPRTLYSILHTVTDVLTPITRSQFRFFYTPTENII